MNTIEQIRSVFLETEKRLSEIIGRKVIIRMDLSTPSKDNFFQMTTLICDALNVSVDAIFSATRKREIAEVRFLVMYFLFTKCYGRKSAIGAYMNKDHTSVIHAIKKVNDRIYIKDDATLHAIKVIEERLKKIMHETEAVAC